MRKKIIGLMAFFILIGVETFSVSRNPQGNTKNFIKSDPTVYSTGLLFENHELNPDAAEVIKVERAAGCKTYGEAGTDFHFNEAAVQ